MSEQGSAESPQPAPTNETPDTQENKEILQHLTPRRSRLLHTTVDAKFFLPSEDTITEEDINKLKKKNPEQIDFRAVNAVSEDSRKEAWKDVKNEEGKELKNQDQLKINQELQLK